jgi:small conductance mechanosensitive channel
MNLQYYIELVTNYLSEYSLKIVAAVLIFIVGKWLTKKLTALSKQLMLKAKIDNTLVEFAESIIYFVLLLMVIFTALNTLGINTTSFLAVFGAASLAIGLALKDSLSNIGAAVIIILFRPFKVGEFIEAAGVSGTVIDINLFSTHIEAIDKSVAIVPNSSVIGGNIINFSRREMRRVDHVFGIGYNDDLRLAKEVMLEVIAADERVLAEPAPLVAVSALADSSVNFNFRVWVKTADYWDVYYDMLEKVKLAFDARGISIPYPQIDIHTDK